MPEFKLNNFFAVKSLPCADFRSNALMNTPALKTPSFEFYFRDLDTLVQVDNPDQETVIVRATRNSFSERRKTYFIRELAAEGFIPDKCQWYPLASGMPHVKWIVDASWLRVSESAKARTRRFMFGLLGGGFLLWTALLSGLLLTHLP